MEISKDLLKTARRRIKRFIKINRLHLQNNPRYIINVTRVRKGGDNKIFFYEARHHIEELKFELTKSNKLLFKGTINLLEVVNQS